MPEPGKFTIDRFDGLNDGLHPSAIKDTELAELYNWIPFGGKLIRRGGVFNIVRNPAGSALNSAFVFTDSADQAHLILAGDAGLFILDADSDVNPIPATSAFGGGVVGALWHMAQVNGIGYAVKDGVGVRRFGTDFHSPAGISPPTWTIAAVQGAAGSIGAGDYQWVATYRNSNTGAESNPNEPGPDPALTLAANKRANLSGFQPSPDPQVDQIRIWRTTADNVDEYFLVDTISHTDTTYTDNKTVDQLGTLVSNDNGLPPSGAKICCVWDDCLVLSDGRDAFVSEVLLPESFSDQVLNAYRDDGADITGLIGWGRRLIVAKTNRMHYFTRTGPRTFERSTLSDRHGCYSHRSLKIVGNYLYWWGGDNIYRSNGYGAEAVAKTEIRSILSRVTAGDGRFKAAAAVIPALSLYLLSVALDGETAPNVVIAVNYQDGSFSVFDHPHDLAPLDFSEPSADTPQGAAAPETIYSVFGDGYCFAYLDVAPFDNDIDSDDYVEGGVLSNAAISCRGKTKAFSRDGLKLALRHFWLTMKWVDPEDDRARRMTIKAYLDGSTTAYKSRTVDLREGGDMKVFNLNTSKRASSLIQVGFEYEDRPTIELASMALDAMVFGRTQRIA